MGPTPKPHYSLTQSEWQTCNPKVLQNVREKTQHVLNLLSHDNRLSQQCWEGIAEATTLPTTTKTSTTPRQGKSDGKDTAKQTTIWHNRSTLTSTTTMDIKEKARKEEQTLTSVTSSSSQKQPQKDIPMKDTQGVQRKAPRSKLPTTKSDPNTWTNREHSHIIYSTKRWYHTSPTKVTKSIKETHPI